MSNLEILKNNLIIRIVATQNEKLLGAIENIFESLNNDIEVQFTGSQKEMLQMAEEDIRLGRYTADEDLYESDKEWLG